MSEKTKRVVLTKRESESDVGAELLGELEEFLEGTFTTKEILELKQFLEALSARANFFAIQFLLDGISKSTVGGKATIRGRLDLMKAIERVLAYGRDSGQPWTHEKPTPRQIERIEWWAGKIGEPFPTIKNKQEAHDAIEWWKAEDPSLEAIWHKERNRRRDTEAKLLSSTFWKGELDDIYDFDYFVEPDDPISDPVVYAVFKSIGWRREGESLDSLMGRFFAELKRQKPNLFKSQASRPTATAIPTLKKTGCLVILCLLLATAFFLCFASSILK
jgi:hypothetical protein